MSIQAKAMQVAAKVVPADVQIKGLRVLHNTKRKLGLTKTPPVFVESLVPDVSTLALENIDVSNPFLVRQGQSEAYFKRLRQECPVHYAKDTPFGPFWSITRHEDIKFVDKHHELFSAEPLILMGDIQGVQPELFIAMDPPKHDEQRMAVQGVVAPKNLLELEGLIRERVAEVLDNLPLDKPFDWVSKVSIELTTRMLATLFDYPYERRADLVRWSDIIAASPEATGGPSNDDNFFQAAADMVKAFSTLWWEKKARLDAGAEPSFDLISLLLSNKDTKDMVKNPMEFFGNLGLLIIGGNDTTRNSMSGGVYALHKFPEQFAKLKANHSLIPNMVSEIIRWQTPLAYMRRIAKTEVELNGQTIRKGDKVIMWYSSGNRDEDVFEDAHKLIIDRKNARNHIAFGFGVHRCMGNRLAEMQLRILWEEILQRFDNIEVVEEPEIVQSNWVRGYSKMMVKLTPVS